MEADALSRSPVLDDFCHNEDLKIINLISKDEIRTHQTLESEKGDKLPNRRDPDGIAIEKRGLFTRTYVPLSLREKIIDEFQKQFGHIGVKKMLTMLS